MSPEPVIKPALQPSTPSASAIAKRLGPAGVLGILWLTLPPLGSIVLFTYINSIGKWLSEHGMQGIVLYSACFAILAGIALIPTYASAFLGGWAFGFAAGFPAALVGFLGGSLIGYTIARLAAKDRAQQIIAENPKWQAVRDALVGGGFWKTLGIVTLVRCPPNSPFAVTNLVLASVKVKPLPYALGTLLGMAPRTGIMIYLASHLRDRLITDAAKDTPWWYIALGVVLTFVVLGVIGLIAQRALKRVTRVESGFEV
jgi:uncharacterized membrane protein YdjX (TVP38/TMEM64 family)